MRSRPPVLLLGALLVSLFGGCGGGGGGDRPSGSGGAGPGASVAQRLCVRRVPDVVAMIAAPELSEVSGMALSRAQPDVIWMHNDSGDRARFFAVGRNGRLRATFEIAGLAATDWEDMAIGPAPGLPALGTPDTLVFADIGDNRKQRSDLQLVMVGEPDVAAAEAAGGTVTIALDAVAVRRFRYPDAPHDAETVLMDPRDGAVFVVTKRTKGFSEVFGIPLDAPAGEVATAVDRGRVSLSPLEMLTAGDVRAQADAIALRSYGTVRIYPLADGQSIPAALEGASCSAPAPPDPQGEAIAFDAEGLGYLTFTESHGASARLYRVGP